MKTHLEPIGLSSAPCHLKPLQAFLSICLMLLLHLSSPHTPFLSLFFCKLLYLSFGYFLHFYPTSIYQCLRVFFSISLSVIYFYFWSFCHILHFITLACTRLGCMAEKYGFSATDKSSECERGTFPGYILTQKDCVCICLCVELAKKSLESPDKYLQVFALSAPSQLHSRWLPQLRKLIKHIPV